MVDHVLLFPTGLKVWYDEYVEIPDELIEEYKSQYKRAALYGHSFYTWIPDEDHILTRDS